MKVLIDSCIWAGAVDTLQAHGHDVEYAGYWKRDPGDEEILRIAHSEERVLVTLDRDFGELAIRHGQPHSGLIRLVEISGPLQGNVCALLLSAYADELKAGAIVTAEPGRIRIRTTNSLML